VPTCSFAIGYIYSFVAAGVFYWALMRWCPHAASHLDHPVSGEEIVAAADEKMILAGERKPHKGMLGLVRSLRDRV